MDDVKKASADHKKPFSDASVRKKWVNLPAGRHRTNPAATVEGNHSNIQHMALEQQIQKDIMEAMKAKDAVRLNAVRAIKSEILLAKTSGGNKELQDNDILKLIQKLSKQRKESAEQFRAAGRDDLADNELSEATVLDAYLPEPLSPEALETRLKAIIAEVGATSPADMGKVMGLATRQLAGLADGKAISAVVRKLLS